VKIEDVRKLHQKKFREEAGLFVLEGEHLVLELQKAAARDPRLATSQIFCTGEFEHWQSPFTLHRVKSVQIQQMSETRSPQGIIAVAPILPAPAPKPGERALYLHQIQDPGNLGTILRTLAWFGNFRCLLSPDSVEPFNGKAVRASMGAILHVPVENDVPLESLPARFERIATLDLQGESIATPAFGEQQCYVFGNEARGLPKEALALIQARAFTIAGTGAIESLNLAAAVAICQYELHRGLNP
jgi:TrmH family RNA methyltransferase